MSTPELFVPPCISHPAQDNHHPAIDKPLRVYISASIKSINRLFPNSDWTHHGQGWLPYPATLDLAKAVYKAIYETSPPCLMSEEMVLRGHRQISSGIPPEESRLFGYILVFDHLVPLNDTSPEVMTVALIDFEASANTVHSPRHILFEAYKEEPAGSMLLIPECCHSTMGSRHHNIANEIVEHYEGRMPKWDAWFREHMENEIVDS